MRNKIEEMEVDVSRVMKLFRNFLVVFNYFYGHKSYSSEKPGLNTSMLNITGDKEICGLVIRAGSYPSLIESDSHVTIIFFLPDQKALL